MVMEQHVIVLMIGLCGLSISRAQDTCQTWRNTYNQYCTQTPRLQQYENSCVLFEQTCLNSGSQSGQGATSQTNNGRPTWNSLTQEAQNEQTQQALANAQNGQANCGQYKEHYNVWCGGIKPVNPTYCSQMQQVCLTQAQQWANGQGPPNFNAFNSGNGLPTAGAGSTRPLTVGQNFGVGPFFGFGKSVGVNPLQGVGTHTGVDVPIAGINVGGGKSVDYGGLLGVAQLGQLLQGRRRRFARPDQFGDGRFILH